MYTHLFLLVKGILDFNREFDVSLMDRVVMAFYSGAGQEVCSRDPLAYICVLRATLSQFLIFSNNKHNKS